jgi:rhodanese-related sulfurtransferase
MVEGASARWVLPDQAACLMRRGYTFVDVRSEPEFAKAHPAGAWNVPFRRVDGDRLLDNPEFLRVITVLFRSDTPLILGCHSGSRSATAAERVRAAGYADVLELRHGIEGARDDFGRRLPGWLASGLAVEHGHPGDRCYADLLARADRERAGDR